MPSVKLLQRFNLEPFIDIRNAVTSGNLLKLNESLEIHQAFFIRTGIYLILEKLKILTYRNLFKKTSLLLGTHQLPIEVYNITTRLYDFKRDLSRQVYGEVRLKSKVDSLKYFPFLLEVNTFWQQERLKNVMCFFYSNLKMSK